jgi:hypothetical protein
LARPRLPPLDLRNFSVGILADLATLNFKTFIIVYNCFKIILKKINH